MVNLIFVTFTGSEVQGSEIMGLPHNSETVDSSDLKGERMRIGRFEDFAVYDRAKHDPDSDWGMYEDEMPKREVIYCRALTLNGELRTLNL